MECIRDDPVIYVRISKDFEIASKKTVHRKKYSLHWEKILCQHKQGKILSDLAL